jgi:N-hydroxyarylamine O-acetyltransferase
MKLQQYLDRIHYAGSVEPTLATLTALHEAHVCSVTFENLDVQLGRRLSLDVGEAFEKIVVEGRGGWCYEQNGLFGWALSAIGFDVQRVAGGVMREHVGETTAANHLCLLVGAADSPARYLADVGFGGSMIRPIPLVAGEHEQAPFIVGLERPDDDHWRFWESQGEGKFSFDFIDEPASEAALAKKCDFLQTDPSSNFVLNLVAQRRARDRRAVLRGRVLTIQKPGATGSTIIESADELVAILSSEFGLDVAGVAGLWPGIVARHEALFGAEVT